MTGVAPPKTTEDDIFVKCCNMNRREGPRPFVRSSLVETPFLMRTLGRPNREQVVTTRPAEMTTLEAIELSNGQPLAELFSRARNCSPGPSGMVRGGDVPRGISAAMSRPPTGEEMERLVQLAGTPLTAAGVEDVLWCIVMLPEFQIVR